MSSPSTATLFERRGELPQARGAPRLSVVIPTYRRSALLARCLRSVAAAVPPDSEILVSDDGSGDDSESVVRDLARTDPRIRWVSGPNVGPAGARNRGWQVARGPVIAFIDDDCIAAPGWGEAFLRLLAAEPTLCGAEGVTEPEHEVPGLYFHSMKGGQGSYLTCNLCVRREALESVGGLDERFPYPHGEDLDLCYRLMAREGPLGFAPDARVLHMVVPISPMWHVRRARVDPSTYRLFALHPARFAPAFATVRLPLFPPVGPERPPKFWQILLYIVASRSASAYFAARDGRNVPERAVGFAAHGAAAMLSFAQLGRGLRAYRAALAEWPPQSTRR